MNTAHSEVPPRLVVVSGGNSGIGRTCVERFERLGDEVHVLDRDHPEAPVDVTDEAAVDAFFAELPQAPSVLVNAAGVGFGGSVVDLDFETWRTVMSVNLDGTFLCLRAAARRMMTADGGVIVNISSINDRVVMRTHAAYCASKAAVSMLTRVAAVDLGRSKIRVVGVAPGAVNTPMVAPTLELPAVSAAMLERTPLGAAMGEPGDVADLVLFLASDAARWITGDTIAVDGGQLQLGFPDLASIIAKPA